MKLRVGSYTQLFIILSCALFAAAFNFRCGNPDKQKDTPKKYASLDSATTYVGMNTCRECHSDIYQTYIQTGMGKSFDVASLQKTSAEFESHPVVYDKHLNFYYKPYWENDKMYISEYRLEGRDTVHHRVEQVEYIVGSGQHTNSHIMNTGGYLNQMPLTFYTQKGQWDLPPGFENGGNSRFSRLIGLECMTCHNSYPEFETGSENKYTMVQNGISCERCHGPGSTHVREKKMSRLVDITKEIDYTIVNPAKLPIDLQLDVCQRCHIQGNAVLNDGKSFTDFRPGMSLSKVMHVFMPVYKGRENEHIMASHVERMKLSRCFIVSASRAEEKNSGELFPYKNAMTCVTCHDPHVSVKTTGSEHFNAACKNCHAPGKDMLCTEDPEKLHLANNNCVSCHMPKSGATDIPHVSVHDHYIRVPVTEAESNAIKTFVGISCINTSNPTTSATGRAFIAYYEKFNFGREVLDSAKKYFPESDIQNNFRELIHIRYLEKDYNGVTAIVSRVTGIVKKLNKKHSSNRDAWTAYRIGESFMQTGDSRQSEIFFGIAYGLAPGHPDFANKFATALAGNGNAQRAYEILETSVKNYPKFPATLSNLGYLTLLTKKDSAAAGRLYDSAIALDPDYDQAVINKAGLLIFMGKNKEAANLINKFLKSHPENTRIKELSAQLKAI